MTLDKIQGVLAVSRSLEWTPDLLIAAAAQLRHGSATLRDALDGMPERDSIQRHYPQGYVALVEGRPGGAGLPALEGFGDRPYLELTLSNAEAALERYQALVRAQLRSATAGRGPRSGASAARQLCYAMRAVDRALVRHGLLTTGRLTDLKEPLLPGPTREPALEPDEVRDFARAVLRRAADPELDATLWLLFRVQGPRPIELERVRDPDVNQTRAAITLVGKGGKRREMPIHRPVLVFGSAAMAARPENRDGYWLRDQKGNPISRRHFNTWSDHLHADAEWARGHRIGPYALRHTAARAVMEIYNEGAVALWLGQRPERAIRVPSIYGLPQTRQGAWPARQSMLDTLWGPATGWPRLTEWDILAPILGCLTP